MSIDEPDVRRRTLARLDAIGFPEPPAHLPLLADAEDPFAIRSRVEVEERLAVVTVRVGLSFGMPLDLAKRWISANGLSGSLSRPRRS